LWERGTARQRLRKKKRAVKIKELAEPNIFLCGLERMEELNQQREATKNLFEDTTEYIFSHNLFVRDRLVPFQVDQCLD
jgi:hypothetical protein